MIYFAAYLYIMGAIATYNYLLQTGADYKEAPNSVVIVVLCFVSALWPIARPAIIIYATILWVNQK